LFQWHGRLRPCHFSLLASRISPFHPRMKRPVVLALNPSVDVEWQVDHVRWEEKNNVLTERRWAGGKGVNVARWLQYLGAKPELILPLGGSSGAELAAALKRERLPARVIPLRAPSRVNVIVSSPAQGQLRFNPLGPKLSNSEWRKVLVQVRRALPRASVLILSGSLPRGVSVAAYAQLIRLARTRCVPVLLDCDGAALRAAAGAGPFLVKPNEHELREWASSRGLRTGRGELALRRAALKLAAVTGGWVFVSRGAKPAWLANAANSTVAVARPPQCRPRHTIGAGDALLAAVAQALTQGAAPKVWLSAGLAAGSAATQCAAGTLPAR
jgi:tagatose 6-phosphate kinase